ncbi:MAG: DUF4058 family protein [Fimbriiglobus sp.]
MPSPFPGMNPYLEHPHVWADFHDRFLVYLAESLSAQTGREYVVRIEEHVFVSDETDANSAGSQHIADVSAAETAHFPLLDAGAAVATIAAPMTGTIPPMVRERVTYLEIRDRRDRRVVTVIEVLSPANKRPGRGRRQFESKRLAFLGSAAAYVEIDLLRGGPRMPLIGLPPCDYYVAVSRADDRPDVGLWPVRLREPLPKIPVPLRPGEPEPAVDLQAILHRVYDAAGYEREIPTGPPDPPLAADDAAWAAALVAGAGTAAT